MNLEHLNHDAYSNIEFLISDATKDVCTMKDQFIVDSLNSQFYEIVASTFLGLASCRDIARALAYVINSHEEIEFNREIVQWIFCRLKDKNDFDLYDLVYFIHEIEGSDRYNILHSIYDKLISQKRRYQRF